MNDRQRSLSLQNELHYTEIYFQSESTPQKLKLKRKSTIKQQGIIQTSPLRTIIQQTPNEYDIYLEGNEVVKEGWLYQNRKLYIELTRQSLIEYTDQSKQTVLRNISLKEFEFYVTQEKQNIRLNFPQIQQNILYQAKDQVESKIWVGCIKLIYDKYRNYPKNKIEKNEISKYFGFNVISEDYFLKIVESGDILLFETNNTGAKLQRMFTNTKYDHVAFAITMAQKYLFIFDANADTGVTFMEWSQFIEVNDLYEKLAIRKLLKVNRLEIEKKLIEFLQQVHGKKYEVTFSKLFRQKSLSPTKITDSYFCSELIAKALKYCGLLTSEKASSSYWPVEFTRSLNLTKGAYFSDEIIVILKKHLTK